MATIATAQAKWERKTANAGSKWKSAVSGKGGAYSAGIQRFTGAPAGPSVVAAYDSGVSAVSAADFQAAIAGKGAKWAANTARGLSGA